MVLYTSIFSLCTRVPWEQPQTDSNGKAADGTGCCPGARQQLFLEAFYAATTTTRGISHLQANPTGQSPATLSTQCETTQTSAEFPLSRLVYMKVRCERLRYTIQLACVYKYMHSNNYAHYFSEGESNYMFFPHLSFSKSL